LNALFSLISGRDLKREALEQTKGKDYDVPRTRDKEIARMADAIAALPTCLGGNEALSVFRSSLRDNASMSDFVNIFTEHAKSLPDGQKSKWNAAGPMRTPGENAIAHSSAEGGTGLAYGDDALARCPLA
jgi:hypothetical protein